MKIREIIETDSDNDNFDAVIRDCKKFLSLAIPSDVMFYRGMDNYGVNKYAARLEKRRPLNTPLNLHNSLNDWFTQHFGRNWRNGVYSTTNLSEINKYAYRAGIVLPVGDFDFLYSPEIPDLFEWFEEKVKAQGKNLDQTTTVQPEELMPYLDPSMFKMGSAGASLKEAAESRNEVIFWCKEYYMVSGRTSKEDMWDVYEELLKSYEN